jgi:hypothetical protein
MPDRPDVTSGTFPSVPLTGRISHVPVLEHEPSCSYRLISRTGRPRSRARVEYQRTGDQVNAIRVFPTRTRMYCWLQPSPM